MKRLLCLLACLCGFFREVSAPHSSLKIASSGEKRKIVCIIKSDEVEATNHSFDYASCLCPVIVSKSNQQKNENCVTPTCSGQDSVLKLDRMHCGTPTCSDQYPTSTTPQFGIRCCDTPEL